MNAFGKIKADAKLMMDEMLTAVLLELKRDLWSRLLAEAYGDEVGEGPLFLQHTYLTIRCEADRRACP